MSSPSFDHSLPPPAAPIKLQMTSKQFNKFIEEGVTKEIKYLSRKMSYESGKSKPGANAAFKIGTFIARVFTGWTTNEKIIKKLQTKFRQIVDYRQTHLLTTDQKRDLKIQLKALQTILDKGEGKYDFSKLEGNVQETLTSFKGEVRAFEEALDAGPLGTPENIALAVQEWKEGHEEVAVLYYKKACQHVHEMLKGDARAGSLFVDAGNVRELAGIRVHIRTTEEEDLVVADSNAVTAALDYAIADRFQQFDDATIRRRDPVKIWTRSGETVKEFETTVKNRLAFAQYARASVFPYGVVETIKTKLKQRESAAKAKLKRKN